MAVDDPPAYADGRTWESPKVARPHDPAAWIAAAGRLRPTMSFGVGGLGLYGTGPLPPIHFSPPVGVGPWAPSHPRQEPFTGIEPDVAGCAHPDPLAGFPWELRASVAKDGKITRCAAHSRHSLAQPAAGACLCTAVQTLELPAGKPGRRLRIEAIDSGGRQSWARFVLVQPGTDAWVTRIDESTALDRCLGAHPLPGAFAARVILALAPDGAVDDVRVEGDITTADTMGLASCLVQELRTVPLPCRPPGVDALHLDLEVKVAP